MAMTVAEAMAQYLNALGPQGQQSPYGIRYDAPPQQPEVDPISKLTGLATSYGTRKILESALSGGTAASALNPATSAGAIEAALANGIYQTPMSAAQAAGQSVAAAAPEAATSISNFAGAATPYLGAAGTAAGAYGAYRGIKDKNPATAALGGLGAALGINAMGFALGPAGWVAMAAAPAIAALANKMSDKDRWETEKKKLQALQKAGTFVPENLIAQMPMRGRSIDELIRKDLAADFVGRDAAGNWANNVFAQSRLESDLRPEDIVGYAAFAEKDKDWFNKPLEVRLSEAKKALDANAVRERRGTIEVDWNKVARALADGQ